ncbi:MAG: FecR domain-containing protein [Acidobacteriota bacterium]|nr:FecR domain-containing protein [Acidobacteriota bacterium]
MQTAKKVLRAFFLVIPFLFAGNIFAEVSDDYVPEVTARVARISFTRGDAQIRRADSQDWERAAQNLPIVEGDEIATDAAARLEIQFNSKNYLRLEGNSYLKIVGLKDEGIAVSLPQGSLSLRVLEFDKSAAYFEIDAPKTTVSVQKEGTYRVDAGDERNTEIRVSVTDNGEARIYSETSGFTLRGGRSAKIYLDGNFAGEWETADASRYADDFDSWSLERDVIIAKRLRDAHYDTYYDRDIYGAEDLTEYGEWVHTRKYGYVWRPFKNSVSSYADWSPYRYGQWRWIPPYGWTWVNDEPWGWATYHHGRWVYDDRIWVWTPYGHQKYRRSWWQPALVILASLGNNVCWYPLPYNYGYNDYNRHYRRNRRNNTTIINNTTVIVNNNPATMQPGQEQRTSKEQLNLPTHLPVTIPLESVITVNASQFGRDKRKFLTASPEIAKNTIVRTPDIIRTPPVLPTFKELNGKLSREILTATPTIAKVEREIKTGATVRQPNGSMDGELRKSRIFGNRPPLQVKTVEAETGTSKERNPETRKTGAVVRSETIESSRETERTNRPIFTPRNRDLQNNSDDRKPEEREIRKPERMRRDDNGSKPSPPVYAPPIEQREKRREPPMPSSRNERPNREEARPVSPPRREEARPQPPPSKRENSPTKSEPKEDRKPAPPLSESKRSKVG